MIKPYPKKIRISYINYKNNSVLMIFDINFSSTFTFNYQSYQIIFNSSFSCHLCSTYISLLLNPYRLAKTTLLHIPKFRRFHLMPSSIYSKPKSFLMSPFHTLSFIHSSKLSMFGCKLATNFFATDWPKVSPISD